MLFIDEQNVEVMSITKLWGVAKSKKFLILLRGGIDLHQKLLWVSAYTL